MIKACIFDLGGTIVDRYSITPLKSLIKTFKNHDINIHKDLIFKDMGISKKIHIGNILEDKYVYRSWYDRYERNPNYNDVIKLHEEFKIIQLKESKKINIIPETYNMFRYLGANNIKIGCTTGFDYDNAKLICNVIKNNIFELDSIVSSTCVDNSRPYSDMINKNMKNMEIDNPKNIIKIDDTNIGIEEGKNAGTWTVGVARWSTNMKVLPHEINILNNDIIDERIEKSKEKLKQSQPDFIIETLDELPNIIETINIYNDEL